MWHVEKLDFLDFFLNLGGGIFSNPIFENPYLMSLEITRTIV
jgi:hypothetical protein